MSTTAEYVAKFPRRKQLLETVEKYWLDEARRPGGSLDSSLKKHTTLINRLKSSLLVGPSEALIKEIDGLTLTKYLEEIVAAVVEGATKKGDTEIAVDVIVHLHTRLAPDFLPLLLQQLLAILATTGASNANAVPVTKDAEKDKEKEDKERLGRQRPVLRIVAELAMLGAWAEGATKGASEVGKILKGFMTGDPQFTNLPLISTFLKYFARPYLGPNTTSAQNGESDTNGSEKDSLPQGITELIPIEVQKKMRELFENYFSSASKTLVKGQIRLLEQDRRNHEAYIKSGEIFEDRQQAYEKMTKAVERLIVGVTTLAELLGLSPPTLPTAASLGKSGLQIVESASSFTVREDGPVAGGIWDDEEERRFYEDLVDLKEVVPSGLLGIKESKQDAAEGPNGSGSGTGEDVGVDEKQKQKQKADEEDLQRQLEQMDLNSDQPTSTTDTQSQVQAQDMSRTASMSTVEDPVQETQVDLDEEAQVVQDTSVGEDDGLQSGPAARLTALFSALPEANNREVVDKLAVEFAFLNSKAARKRLIKFIGEVPKQRTDLLPHYARFVATLDRHMPDIGTGVLQILDEEMRYLQRKRLVRELDSLRLKNVRFYGELAKFKVAKPYTILHVLKVFLDEFKFNIENIANLLETAGRFLLRFEGTKDTAKKMVELMRRKQGTSHLDQRHQVMLENAFYMCNPPERVAREVVVLSPMQSFIQHLLHDILMKRTLDKVLKLLRKLHWEDAETYDFILMSFTSPNDIKFGNIPFLAALVHDLQRYHPEFSISVVEQVMEDIRIGMEENIFKHNQKRIATIRYLGELYMYRVIGAGVVFETLWSLLSFGHADPFPIPGRESPIDAIDDFFRVRLACTLLDTCGACFDKGSQARKLDHYLVMLQLYVTCKTEIPMDVEFMLTDTLDTLRPKMTHLKTFNEAAAKVDEILALGAEGEGEDDAESEDGSEAGDRGPVDADDLVDANDAEANPMLTERDEVEEEEEENVVLIKSQNKNERSEVDEQAESEFDREFARLLADTTDTRRDQRKNAPPVFDTAVPLIRKRPEEQARSTANVNGIANTSANANGNGDAGLLTGNALEGKMQFMLLSKKGNRQQIRSLDIPVDSNIAMNSRTHQAQSKAEQEQLKRLVLQNERRLERAEVQDIETRGVKLRFLPS